MQTRRIGVAVALLFGSFQGALYAHGATQAVSGKAVFERICAACHLSMADLLRQKPAAASVSPASTAPTAHTAAQAGSQSPRAGATAVPAVLAAPAGARAVPRERLRQFTPEAILAALSDGKMKAEGALLSEAERRAVAVYASGRDFGADAANAAAAARNRCRTPRPMNNLARSPHWNGWGNGLANTRFQSAAQGGLTAADLPHLKLEWAFGYANVSSARTQPAIAGGRLFAASENGQVHALNPRTGCSYWMFKADAGVATAPSVGVYHDAAGRRGYAVYFGDRKANVYAVNAQTGKLIWKRKVDDDEFASITGAPALYAGRLYVPVQGVGEESQGARGTYSCCRFRGSLVALDADTGAVLWKTYTVGPNRPRGRSPSGVEMYGPAGGGVWSAPTIDVKRQLVYISTGNGYADPPQPTTDSVIALDLKTGAIRWVRQVLHGDDWQLNCPAHSRGHSGCPALLGPDFDFAASAALTHVHGRDLLVIPQKSGLAFALDPDRRGAVVWQYRFGAGSAMGGQWGTAVDATQAYFGAADLQTPTPGGMRAVNLASGRQVWSRPPPAPPLCGKSSACKPGQGGALTVIPGAVLNAGLDGGLRAYSTRDGSLLWQYDTNRSYHTVNGVKAHGGGMDAGGPVVAGGMLYISSGAGGFVGAPGNVLLAFGLK